MTECNATAILLVRKTTRAELLMVQVKVAPRANSWLTRDYLGSVKFKANLGVFRASWGAARGIFAHVLRAKK